MLCILCYACVALVLVACLYFVESFLRTPRFPLEGKHILITGASSGIGLALAHIASREGAKVTLVARNKQNLEESKTAILADPKRGAGASKDVQCLPLDVAGDYETVQKAVSELISNEGNIDVLVNCAGICVAKTFEDITVEEIARVMQVNFLGSVQMTKAALPFVLRGGRVAFVSSVAGQMGLYGYTAYSPSKFALRGFAEALQMEVKPRGIQITVAYPPDTDTKGLEQELLQRPEELRVIAGMSGLISPETVAKGLLADIRAGQFHSSFGLDGVLVTASEGGLRPPSTISMAAVQVAGVGVIRLFLMVFSLWMDWVVARHAAAKKHKPKKN